MRGSVGRKRVAAGALAAACLILLVGTALLAISAGGSEGPYTVRAIFDDAGNVIAGEQVKIQGVVVGTVNSVTPTPDAKAAVVLSITNSGFKDFRQDATCTIRPQALIGEKYVDCTPTQPRPEGTPLPPPLYKIGRGEGEGQYLLPVTNTHSPVDVDLLGDISRLPERQRFTIILNELGAGLAGRGSDLNVVLRRANPALQELDKVLSILAGENKVLAELAVNSSRALGPFARVRGSVAEFIDKSNEVAKASARHTSSIAQNLKLFPPFLRQLGPSMERLQRFAEAATPVFADLKVAAPGLNQAFVGLPAFSSASASYFKDLGARAKTSGPALVATEPLLKQLSSLGASAKPFSTNLASLLSSVKETGGIERLLDFIFLGANAANGYDQLGHFLRAEGVATTCVGYKIVPTAQCNRKLANTGSPSAVAAGLSGSHSSEAADTSVLMARTLAVIKGATPAEAVAEYPGPLSTTGTGAAAQPGAATTAPVGGSTGKTTYYSPSSEGSEAGGLLLNYLLGN